MTSCLNYWIRAPVTAPVHFYVEHGLDKELSCDIICSVCPFKSGEYALNLPFRYMSLARPAAVLSGPSRATQFQRHATFFSQLIGGAVARSIRALSVSDSIASHWPSPSSSPTMHMAYREGMPRERPAAALWSYNHLVLVLSSSFLHPLPCHTYPQTSAKAYHYGAWDLLVAAGQSYEYVKPSAYVA